MKNYTILFFIFTISSIFSQENNLIKNGGFENDYGNWQTATLSDSRAFFKNESENLFKGTKSLKIQVEKLGKETWDINMVQPFKSKKGATYEIKFHAKTNRSGKTVKAQLQNTTYNGKEFFLSTDWKEYKWVTKAEESDLSLAFHFISKGNYYFDNVSVKRLRKGTSSSKKATTQYNSASNTSNLMTNGGFENGFEGWVNLSEGKGKALYKLNRKKAYEGRVSMKVNVLKQGVNPWDVQSMKAISLKKNKKYRIRFNAKSTGEKKIKIQIQDEDKKIYLANEFETGFEWQEYAWVFTAESSNMKLAIHHISRGTVEYDNIIIEQIK